MKRLVALLMLVSLLLGAALPSLGEEEKITYTGTVTGGSLHLRKEPSPSGKIINTYKEGTQVEILENDGAWCKVKAGKNTGYMMTQYLDIKPNYSHLGWGKTPADGTVLNVRANPEADARIVYKTMSGAAFELVAESGDWYKVRVGDGFGYLPKAALSLMEGDFLPDLTPSDEGLLTPDMLKTAPREIGGITTVSQDDGVFSYAVTYPSLGSVGAWLNGEISAWCQDTLHLFQQDHRANHPGETASYTVEYQAVRVDEQYFSILLLGRYQVGALYVDAALALNWDEEADAPLPKGEELIVKDQVRALFCLESAVSLLLPSPACGYTGQPDFSWLQYAVLGKDGVEIVLPAGLFLPGVLGTRRLTLSYQQIADCMALSEGFIAAHSRYIDPTKPMIALTFDDGPSEETDRILKVLTRYGGRATFCVIGSKLEDYADVLKRTIAQGSEIACHTWSHPHFDRISSSKVRPQIEKVVDAVREITGGYEIKVLRPPYGTVTAAVRTACKDLGLIIAKWEVDTDDWQTRNADKTYKAIMKNAQSGVIVLCHDIYSTTASAVERAIPELVAKGYQLVTVSELLSFHKDGVEPGKIYIRLDPENIAVPDGGSAR